MLNHITLMGRIVRDPELKTLDSGVSVASFTIACERDFGGDEKKVDFVDCKAWRKTGEFISKYFNKGRMIVVDGRLELRDWTDKDGNKRRNAEINVASTYFGDSKKDGSEGQQGATSYQTPVGAGGDFEEITGDDSTLPF